VSATVDGSTANGHWSARQKAVVSELAAGTWTVTRK